MPRPAADDSLAKGEHQRGNRDQIKSFLSGGCGGISAVLVGQPFDLTKTRLQTARPGTYNGGLDVVKKTVAADGIRGLYRGMLPPLLGVTPIFALSFWSYDMGKKLVYAATPARPDQTLSLPELAFAGFFSAVPTTLATGPAERVKVLLQLQGQRSGGPQYSGVGDVLKQLYAEGGLRSIFRGTGATLARDGPGSAAYFCVYEAIKRSLTPADAHAHAHAHANAHAQPGDADAAPGLGRIILAGGTAGMAMWSLAIPPDVIKSRLQGAPPGTYNGFADCVRKTIAADGVSALFRGFWPAMARAIPANAATFVGVEYSLAAMNKLW